MNTPTITEKELKEYFNESLEQYYPFGIEWAMILNYPLSQCNFPFINRISLNNNTKQIMTNITIEISFQYDFIDKFNYSVNELREGKFIELKPELNINSRKIFELTEIINDRMVIKIMSGEELIIEQIYNFDVLPVNYWLANAVLPESIASFVMPNIPEITILQRRVSQILKDTTGDSSVDGYQSNDKNRTRQIIASIYAAIFEQNIVYGQLPASFFTIGQRVRTPDEVLKYKIGNCIEMAVLFASVAEACGLNPIIIVKEGHAFSGCWLVDGNLDSNTSWDITEINKRISDGINEIEVFEAVGMNESAGLKFENAVRRAVDYLNNIAEYRFSIDIRRTHFFGIKPIPFKIIKDGEINIIDYGLVEDAEKTATLTKSLEDYFLDTSKKENVDKSTIWMRNLLDLSKRNSLISFKSNSKKNIQIYNSNLSQLEDALSGGDCFDIREVVSDWTGSTKNQSLIDVESKKELIDKISETEFKMKRIRTFLEPPELEKTLKELYRDAKKSTEESGSSSLFLALGFLKWNDPKERIVGGKPESRYAPLVLLPVELIRKSNTKYQLQLRNEDPQMNITILEMLRQNFNLNISGLNPLPEDESGVDIPLVFNSIRKAIMDKSGWDVLEMAILGNFSFSQFVMWNDLKKRFDRLLENKVINALVSGRYTDYTTESVDTANIEVKYNMSSFAIPSSTDSSQLSAIIEASMDSSFVLHGPPGTGKSQTITNMIGNALFQGKSVLFVAEKMAALNVVYDRLNSIGLGDFCLEIHSNKTQKTTVLEKLKNNLFNKKTENLSEFARKSDRIDILKRKLNKDLENLHKVNESGFSLYDLINIFSKYEKQERFFIFSESNINNINRNSWDELHELFKRLTNILKELNFPVSTHPLKEFQKAGFSLSEKEKLIKILSDIKSYSTEMISLCENKSVKNFLSIMNDAYSFETFKGIQTILNERNIKIDITTELWDRIVDDTNLAEMADAITTGKKLNKANRELSNDYTADLSDFDWKSVKMDYLKKSSAFLFKVRNQRNALIPLRSIAKSNFIIDENNALSEFDRISEYQELFHKNEKNLINIESRLKFSLNSFNDKIGALEDMLDIAVYFKTRKSKMYTDSALIEIYKTIIELEKIRQGFVKEIIDIMDLLNEKLEELESISGISKKSMQQLPGWINTLPALTNRWNDNLGEWKTWSVLYGILEEFKAKGYNEIPESFFGIITNESFKNIDNSTVAELLNDNFTLSLSFALIDFYLKKNHSLSRFSGVTKEAEIEEYNSLINDYEELSRKQIINSLYGNLPDRKTCSDKESRKISDINRIIQSKGRGTSLRKLFQNNGDIIKKVTPCMLMSPLSVAQYIDLDFPKFDLVIFDEASQIRTGYAIGAMSRGKNVIIVGDPKQMPPTSFFSSKKFDEDNIDIEDLESLLEDCLAVNMPQKYLACHYRSKSESLIAFSNQMYYDGKMLTFPSTSEVISKVKFIGVNGIYDRGKTRTNRIEADEIVSEIISRLKKEGKDSSIGVITFNTSQQELIDDLLSEKIAADSELEKILNDLKEPIFIKNLENVQGDERDTILFSIAFGRDSDGVFHHNFGPLAKNGGWRRLNVAVSRARAEMIIYSSILPQDIRISPQSSEGVKGLKKFLEFSLNGQSVINNINIKNPKTEDNIIKNISTFLHENGFNSHINIGNSDLSVNLAILDRETNDNYICSIMIDGPEYYKLNSNRDRNRLVPSVLRSKGWEIYRIWSLDWIENPEYHKNKILSYVQGIQKEKSENKEKNSQNQSGQNSILTEEGNINKLPEIPEIGENPIEDIIRESLETENESKLNFINSGYKLSDSSYIQEINDYGNEMRTENKSLAGVSLQDYSRFYFDRRLTPDRISLHIDETESILKSIIAAEAPINEDILIRRVASVYGITRLTAKTTQEIKSIIKNLNLVSSVDLSGTYYWGKINRKEYLICRSSDPAEREIDKISSIELANAAALIIQESYIQNHSLNISEKDLLKKIAAIFNISRITPKIHSNIYRGIEMAELKFNFEYQSKGEIVSIKL